MIKKIQQDYYLNAQNPSDDKTLITIAKLLNLNEQQFTEDLNSTETQQQLASEMEQGRQLGARGFPSMILVKDQQAQYLPLDYNNAAPTVELIKSML